MQYARTTCAAMLIIAAGSAFAGETNFDSLSEGFVGSTFTDGGITFYGLDRRISGDPDEVPFAIEATTGASINHPEYTPPNVLDWGGFSPGDGAAFSRLGEFSMTTGRVETFASIDFFDFFTGTGVSLTLEAIRSGSIVGSDTFDFTSFADQSFNLTVSGVEFDTLRVNATSNGAGDPVVFVVADNVRIVPAPGAAAAFLTPGLLVLRRQRRR